MVGETIRKKSCRVTDRLYPGRVGGRQRLHPLMKSGSTSSNGGTSTIDFVPTGESSSDQSMVAILHLRLTIPEAHDI